MMFLRLLKLRTLSDGAMAAPSELEEGAPQCPFFEYIATGK